MSTQPRAALSSTHRRRLSNRALVPPGIFQRQSDKRKGEYEFCLRQCHVDHTTTRAMSNDASYHEGGTEQTHKKLCQTKLLNPLERWKTLGTDWMGVICELEGVVLSDLSPSHRAAWRNLAYEENLPCPREYDIRHYQNLKAEQLICQVFNWTQNKDEVTRLLSRKQDLFYEQLQHEGAAPRIQQGVLELLNFLQAQRITCILISPSTRIEVDHMLVDSRLRELILRADLLDTEQDASLSLITAENVQYSLPDTESIILGCSILERPFERIIVVGSSLQTLEAAREMNTRIIMVSGRHRQWELKHADLVVSALDELSFQNLRELLHDT